MDETQPNNVSPKELNPQNQPIQETSTKTTQKKPYNKKVHGKRYSIAQKLAIKAIQNAGLSAHEAVPFADVSRRTIARIWEDKELDDLAPNVVTKVKNGLGGLFYKRALGAALSISPEKLSESSALQLATVAGIMTEKARLMEGLSTENVSHRGVIEAIESDREKLMEKLKELDER